MKIESTHLDQYLVKFPFVVYYCHYFSYLNDYWKEIDKIIESATHKNFSKLKEHLDDQIDNLLFIGDMIKLGNDHQQEIIMNGFLSYSVIPGIFGGFTSNKKGSLSITLCIYLLV